ncbi:MAG: hypothetical protein EPN97_10645 [Alphaproteobacteria bacterium]|nr:MAG: hypothetical protein EPN97_10645 [Alphaproteobacteria bacterium]
MSKEHKKQLSEHANKHFKKAIGKHGEFTIGISPRKLNDIIANKTREMDFSVPDEAFNNLSPANQRALAHLVKAAAFLDQAFLKQDHPDNIRARKKLTKAAAKGNKLAEQALTLFTIHNGLEGSDMYSKKTKPLGIFSDKKLQPGKGYYPQDLTKKELADYIVAHPEMASAIFSNNTIVQRDGDRLIAVPYSQAFRDEMQGAARELLLAAKETDHKGLAEYLRWQAAQLVNDSDPETGYTADKLWIGNLEDSPLEFTIGRENYEDRMSADAAADPRVKKVLEENGIKAKAKDAIGVRVGIVNKESYAEIADYRKHMENFAKEMPLKEQYASQSGGKGDKMTFADVDLVAFTGDYAAVRGGITVAQNLPNDDKLAVELKEGSRLVFHRQVRQGGDPAMQQRFLDALVDPAQHKFYDRNADFLFTIGHELVHSLGPRTSKDGRDKSAALGKWGSMLEENKADVGSIVLTQYFVDIGKFTQEEANKIFLTWAADELPAKQPSDDEAHRSRSIMQMNYFREKGAIQFEKGGKLSIVPEKMADVARQMLTEVIQLQLDGDPSKAEAFVKKYTAWNDALQYAAEEKMKMKPKLYRLIRQPMRDKILKGP